VEAQIHAFLTTALDGGEWSVSCLSHFTPRVKAPGTHWTGGCVGPTASLEMAVRRKLIPSLSLLGTEPWLSSL